MGNDCRIIAFPYFIDIAKTANMLSLNFLYVTIRADFTPGYCSCNCYLDTSHLPPVTTKNSQESCRFDEFLELEKLLFLNSPPYPAWYSAYYIFMVHHTIYFPQDNGPDSIASLSDRAENYPVFQ